MKPAKEIRVGNIIMVDSKPMIVLRSDVNGSSRTGFTYKWKMKNLLTNSPQENVFRGDDKFDVVVLDKKPVTYSYFADPLYVFMDADYEQFEIEEENLGDALHYLKDGMECEAIFYDGKAISVELPTTIVRQVVYSEPAVKGNTSGNVLKEAKIENAIEAHSHSVQVPLFVSQDDMIEIDTRTNEYKRVIRN
ncbi:elongation factor P [Undibacterium sp. RTI2.1]|uniref:elongation factor P n=1 Tax=unclassified Undibacterium TaxID=2630295 RepID=UPI002AB3417F|nr:MULTISPECIES: elongation factor P [unclassified Undibacterium]MDY7536904.1 elongation factor P [Undibacterium sp. 5I1]MEB0031666.1 elongation factor P [Undibacterium sp. RTI2.1]MEB0117937.1 elongation factor P [Undibacterium sp. RTI2.2]MEB0230409.1 elongation factor P [Undibacterium sp. 10I3]MEB0258827.1 elongation factor P [Undibacterium sp. 5I1]